MFLLPFVRWSRGGVFGLILFFDAIALNYGGWMTAAGFLFTIIGLVMLWNYLGRVLPTAAQVPQPHSQP